MARSEAEGLREQVRALERDAATAADAIKAQCTQAEEQKTAALERLKALQTDYEALLLQANKSTGSTDTLRQKLAEVSDEKSSAAKQVEELQQQLAAARKKAELLMLQIEGLEEEKAALRKQLEVAQTLLKETRAAAGAGPTPPDKTAP